MKFEFKVTVHLWATCTQLWPRKSKYVNSSSKEIKVWKLLTWLKRSWYVSLHISNKLSWYSWKNMLICHGGWSLIRILHYFLWIIPLWFLYVPWLPRAWLYHYICDEYQSIFLVYPYGYGKVSTLLDHCLKNLHNTVKHMNLPTVV